jgi:hypothetical protein
MFSLAGKVLDVYDDLKMDHLKENLSKIGTLKLAPIDQVMKLPNEQFALVCITKTGRAIRKFPVHDADSTAISNLYFDKHASKLPPEARAVAATFLKKANDKFKLAPSKTLEKQAVGNISSNIVDLTKCSQEDPVVKAKHNALGNEYPIDTPMQVKVALDYFAENATLFKPENRHQFANAVAQRAAELNVPIPQRAQISKYAGAKFGNLVDSAMHERMNLITQDPQATKALRHLFEKRASIGPERFASILEKFDVTMGIDRFWDRGSLGIRDPFRSTFENVKMASVIKVGGKNVDSAKIQKLAGSEALKRNFDSQFCEAFNQDPVTIFESLPRPEQSIILSMIE